MSKRQSIIGWSLIIGLLTTALLIISSCANRGGNSSKSNSSIDGTYYWSDFQVSHTVVISGDRWTGTSIVYGERTNDFGTVKGNHLYDSSGYIEVARIHGNTIDWGNHRLKKDF